MIVTGHPTSLQLTSEMAIIAPLAVSLPASLSPVALWHGVALLCKAAVKRAG